MMSQTVPGEKINAMSVDVEDYFQVSAFESHVERQSWEATPLRVERNVEKLLELFEGRNIRATFFTLGWIAQRAPGMVRRIVEGGHEVASHGWEHVRATEQSPDQFRVDVDRTKKTLEDISGCEITGYRAASYSIGEGNLWAHDVLADTGHSYSSSIVPVKHDLYGMPDAPRFPFRVAQGRLLEIPISTVGVLGKNVNCGGGGWFRLFPYGFSKWALRRINEQESQSHIFYLHPWEIDPDQPKLKGLPAKTRLRHYLNLARMEGRLERLVDDFRWGRVDEVYLSR